jgi:hypothetical protein
MERAHSAEMGRTLRSNFNRRSINALQFFNGLLHN